MKALKYLSIFLVLVWVSFQEAFAFQNLTTDETANLLQKDIVVLDVRTAEEFNQGHLAKALNLDFYNPQFKDFVSKLDKSKNYLVYCRSGKRSASASQQMESLGFTQINNMLGGFSKWASENRPWESK